MKLYQADSKEPSSSEEEDDEEESDGSEPETDSWKKFKFEIVLRMM